MILVSDVASQGCHILSQNAEKIPAGRQAGSLASPRLCLSARALKAVRISDARKLFVIYLSWFRGRPRAFSWLESGFWNKEYLDIYFSIDFMDFLKSESLIYVTMLKLIEWITDSANQIQFFSFLLVIRSQILVAFARRNSNADTTNSRKPQTILRCRR